VKVHDRGSNVTMTTTAYESWLRDVDEALRSIGMPMGDWQSIWPFDFGGEFAAGTAADAAAGKANRFWWKRQNQSLNQHCRKDGDCWLPQNHQGECEPV
jgi:hypothetical protein